MSRTVRCSDRTRAGRLAKARQFWSAAQTIEAFADDETTITDAYATLAVHAGIAAADVICCARLGEHARGDDHDERSRSRRKRTRPGPKTSPRCCT